MRTLGIALLLLAGCVTSVPVIPIEPQLEAEVLTVYPQTREEYLAEVVNMIAERNRIQRRLYSISMYQLDLPPEIRAAIHCTDLIQDLIEIPNTDYLSMAGAVINSPAQMEQLLVGFIKSLMGSLYEYNDDVIINRVKLTECYNKFKPEP